MNLNRTLKPKESGKISFNLPEIKRINLDNGLDIYFVYKPELPIIQMNLMCNAGSKFDGETQKGLSLLTSMLLDEGAGEYSALQLDEEFESMGSVLKISADQDSIFVNTLCLTEHFDRTLQLYSTIILQPSFTDSDFNREQKKLIDKITQLSDEPSYIASTNFEKLIFHNHTYGFPTAGIRSNLKSVSNQNVKNFYSGNFKANNAKLIVVGNIKEDILKAKLKSRFSNWAGSNLSEVKAPDKVYDDLKVFIVDKKDAPQSEIRIGHIGNPRKTDDFYAKVIMNTILGGQFSSRINLNLREDKGYTYGVNSGFHFNKLSGYFSVSTAVQSENTVPAISEIIKELNLIREEIKEEELQFAKAYLTKRFPSMFETYTQVAVHLSSKVLYSLPDNYFDTYLERINAVALNEARQAAIDNIFPDKLIILIVGNKDLLFEDLRKNFGNAVSELKLPEDQI